MLGFAILSASSSRLAAGPYDNLANVSVTQAGGTVSGTYALDLQGYTQINLISITVGTVGSCQDNPVSWSGSMNGWAGQPQNASWAGMLGIGGGYTLTFSNLTRNASTGVWSAGTVYYSCNASNGYVYNASSVTDAGGSLSYPGGAAHGNQSNSFTSTGSFTLGTAITWSMTATNGASNFQYAFQISGLSGPPISQPISFTWPVTSFTYNGSSQGPTPTPQPVNGTYSLGSNVTAIAAGSYYITAAGTGSYTGTGNSNWVINPAPTSFSISPTSFTYNGGAQGPTITPNPAGATYSLGGTPSATAAGSYSVSVTANGNYTGASGAVGYTINKAAASVTLSNLTKTYNGTPQGATVTTGPGGLSVSVTYNGSGTVPTNAGSYAVAATVADPNYTGSATGTLTINPEPVTFSITPSFPYNGSSQSPTITPSVGGATYSVSGTTSATAAGSYSVTAAAYGNYTGTTTGTWTINASSASFSISPTSFTYNGSSQGPTITPSPAGVTFGTAGTPAATAAGSYTVTATANGSYSGTSGATPWTISKATPAGTLTWATPAAITYGTALNATQLDASSTLPGSFVYTPAAGAVLNAGTQTLSVTFTPTDTTDYTSATATVSLVVNPEPVTFTVAPVSFPYNGSSQGPTITPSPAGATFGTTGATSAISVGSYSLTASATGNYAGTSGAQGWAITKANPVITWATPAAITYGTALGATQLNATATVPGTFVYSPAAGAVLSAGTQTLSVTFTPTDGTDYNTATQNVSLTVNPAPQTVAVTPASQTVPLGQLANFTASGSNTGYTWTGATGTGASATQTWGAVGTYTVTVQAPASGNYAASNMATATVTVTLKQQTVTITPSAPTLTAGQSVTLTASGGQNGYTWGGVISGSGPTQSPSFPNVGTYTVTAFSAAGNNYAQSNTASAVVTVNAAGQTVSITPTNPSVQAGQSLTFTASGGFTPYVWGGQATGTGPIQTPIFGSVGTYPVTVYAQAQGNYAQSNTATALVTATTIPQTITVTPSQATIYVNASVTLTAAGGNTSYNWGGAASGAGTTQKLSWATPGTYTVTVQAPASGNYAASNTATATISVKTTVPGIKNNSDTGSVGVQGAQATDPNAIIPPSN